MFRRTANAVSAAVLLWMALISFITAQATLASTCFTENFSTNPSNTWSFGIGDNSNDQFTWNPTAPPAYTGDATGELDVHLNSSLPTVRFQRPLGVTVTDTNDFTLTARFSFSIASAPSDQDMQIAFGLVNSARTGSNRTGTAGIYTDDDTFHTVEFDYFPNANPWDPTLTPSVFGAQKNGEDAFANFASIFGYGSSLGIHTNGITALPQNVTLQATLAYTASNKTCTLTISQVNSNGSLTTLDTETPPLNLVTAGYDSNFPFRVDSLAIMAYQDGFTTPDDPSLVADLQFQGFDFTTSASAPQPPGYVSINIVGTNVCLAFLTVTGQTYYIQSRTDFSSTSWSTIATNIAGTGGIMTNTDIGGAMAPSKFYRIGLAVPPP